MTPNNAVEILAGFVFAVIISIYLILVYEMCKTYKNISKKSPDSPADKESKFSRAATSSRRHRSRTAEVNPPVGARKDSKALCRYDIHDFPRNARDSDRCRSCGRTLDQCVEKMMRRYKNV